MRELSLVKKAPANIIWNFLGQGWLIILALITTPFIVRRLGTSLYGIYVLISVVIDYFAFLQLGMGAAAIRYISLYLAKKDLEKVREIFWTGMVSHFFLGLLGVALIIVLSGTFVYRFLHITSSQVDIALVALRIGSVGFLVSLLSGMAAGLIRTLGRFDILNIMGILLGSIQVGATVVVLVLGFSLKEIIIANLAVQLMGLLGYTYYGIKGMPEVRKWAWSKDALIKLLTFGGFVTVSGIVGPILTNIEKIFLTTLRSVTNLTYYAVPFSLINRLSVIPVSFSSVLFPLFSYYQGEGGSGLTKELHFRSVLYLSLIYSVPFLFIIFYGGAFLSWWMGEDFALHSTTILMLLGLAGFINASAYPSITALQGLGKPQWPALFHVLETVLYIPIGYFLIARYGGVGAAGAWLLRVLVDTVLLHMATCHVLGESVTRWYGRLIYHASCPL